MAARVFDPMTPPPRGLSFFPIRYTRGQDLRKVALLADRDQNAYVQEKAFHIIRNKESRFLDSGETRQTKAAPWSARRRPTHFVALRLPRECTLRSSIIALNNDVKESFTMAQWHEAFIPASRLHLTLSVLTIDPETEAEKLEKAQRITAHYIRDWQRVTRGNGFTLRSNSLGFFDNGRVAFAKLSPDYDLMLLNKCVKEMRIAFANEGIDIKGNPNDDFVPHVTVAKISQKLSKEKLNGARSFPKSIFAHMQWDDLGLGKFHEIDLCAMRPLVGKKVVVEELLGDDGQPLATKQEVVGDESNEATLSGGSAFEGLEVENNNETDSKKVKNAVTPSENKIVVPYYDTLVRGSLLARRRI